MPISSSLIDLDDLGGLAGALRAAATTRPPATEPGGRVIPAATVPTPRLPGMNVDINLHGKRVAGSEGPPLADAVVAFRLKDRALALDPLTFGVAGG